MPELPTRPPRRNEETGPFWDACAERRLVLPRCTECEKFIWYPRSVCPFCGSTTVSWEQVSGAGTVYTFTIIRRGMGSKTDPMSIAYPHKAPLASKVVIDACKPFGRKDTFPREVRPTPEVERLVREKFGMHLPKGL
mgnify:CR=1 FL=1